MYQYTEADVRRAWQWQCSIDMDTAEGRDVDADHPYPGVELVVSERAVRGTAEADMRYNEVEDEPGRVAPVVSVSAGYRAQSECVRYVTLVRS